MLVIVLLVHQVFFSSYSECNLGRSLHICYQSVFFLLLGLGIVYETKLGQRGDALSADLENGARGDGSSESCSPTAQILLSLVCTLLGNFQPSKQWYIHIFYYLRRKKKNTQKVKLKWQQKIFFCGKLTQKKLS